MMFSKGMTRLFNVAALVLLCTFATACLTGCNEDKKYQQHLDKGDKYFAAGDYSNALAEYEESLKNGQKSKKITPEQIAAVQGKIEVTTRKLKERYNQLAGENFDKGNGLLNEEKYYEARDAYLAARQYAANANDSNLVKQVDDILAKEPFLTMQQIDEYEKEEMAKIEKYETDELEPHTNLKAAQEKLYNAQKNYIWYKSLGYTQDDYLVKTALEDVEDAEFDLARAIGRVNDPGLDASFERLRSAYSHYSLMVWLHGEEDAFTDLAYDSYLLEKERFNGKIAAVVAVAEHKVSVEVTRRKIALKEEVERRKANLPEPEEVQEVQRVVEDEF